MSNGNPLLVLVFKPGLGWVGLDNGTTGKVGRSRFLILASAAIAECSACQWHRSGFRCFGDTVASSALGRTGKRGIAGSWSACFYLRYLKKQNYLANMCRTLHWVKFNAQHSQLLTLAPNMLLVLSRKSSQASAPLSRVFLFLSERAF
jgi:hypothetical protein